VGRRHGRQTCFSFYTDIKNLSSDTTSASIPGVTAFKSSLSMYVFYSHCLYCWQLTGGGLLSEYLSYIVATKRTTVKYFINPISLSACVSLLLFPSEGSVNCNPPFFARQRLGKHFPVATNTRNNRRTVGHVRFCAIRVLSKSVCGYVCPLSLLGNNSVHNYDMWHDGWEPEECSQNRRPLIGND
jgi:hypothetical protein